MTEPCFVWSFCRLLATELIDPMNVMWVQVATLVNALTHLLAGKQKFWFQLDFLHAALCAALHALSEALEVTNGILSEYKTRLEEVDNCLNALLQANASTSACVQSFYCACAASNAAFKSLGMLYVAAAAAHCAGSCTDANAKDIRLAALAVLAAHEDLPPEVTTLLHKRVRKLATSVVSSRDAPGTGSVGCACRIALCESLNSGISAYARLLSKERMQSAMTLAVRDARSSQRCSVLAQVCGGKDREGGETPELFMKIGYAGHCTRLVFVSMAYPVRKRIRVGCARQSPAALAALYVAAERWVEHDDEWEMPGLPTGAPHTALCYESQGDHDFDLDGGIGHRHPSFELTEEVLSDLGYRSPLDDNLLVYAVVEDLLVEPSG